MPPQAVRARSNRAGSSTSRAIARASRACSMLSVAPIYALSVALSASARARTAGATSAGCAFWSVRAASNQVSPSRIRPRASHSGCSDDASCDASLDIGVFAAPRERGPQVVDLGFGLLETLLMAGRCRGVEQGRHGRVVIAVTGTHGVGLAGLAELFQCVLAHRLQQPVSRWATCAFGHDQGLVDQQCEQVEDLEAFHVAAAGDRLCGVEVEPAHKHRQPGEQDAFGLGQQRVRPIHRGPQRLLAAHRGACTPGQQPEAVMQAVADLGQRQARAPAPPPARSPAARRRGAGRSPPRWRRCRR